MRMTLIRRAVQHPVANAFLSRVRRGHFGNGIALYCLLAEHQRNLALACVAFDLQFYFVARRVRQKPSLSESRKRLAVEFQQKIAGLQSSLLCTTAGGDRCDLKRSTASAGDFKAEVGNRLLLFCGRETGNAKKIVVRYVVRASDVLRKEILQASA